MRMVTAAVTSLILTIGSAASCAAADLPREGGFGPGPEATPFMEARVVCNAFGRCFRVRPYRNFYAPDGRYGDPGFGAPPRVGGAPIYGAGPRFGDEPRFGGGEPRFGGGEPRYGGDEPRYGGAPRYGVGPGDGEEPRYGERGAQAPGFEHRRPDEGQPRYGERREGPPGDPYRGADGTRRPDGFGSPQTRPGPYPRGDDYGER